MSQNSVIVQLPRASPQISLPRLQEVLPKIVAGFAIYTALNAFDRVYDTVTLIVTSRSATHGHTMLPTKLLVVADSWYFASFILLFMGRVSAGRQQHCDFR